MSEFGTYTEAYLLAQMIAQVSSGVDTSEGSVTRSTLAPMAVELAEGYVNLDEVITLLYPQTTNGTYLDNWAALRGLTRKTGDYAAGSVTFTGTSGTSIPSGTKVQTSGGLVYDTTGTVTIASGETTINANIQAEAVGTAYNVVIGAINSLPVAVSGISAVTNAAAITGGTDKETDAALLVRFLADAQNPSTSGNKSDYYNCAFSVSGV